MSMYKFLQYHVGEFMTKNPVSVTRDVTLRDIENMLHNHDFNALPVVENGKLAVRHRAQVGGTAQLRKDDHSCSWWTGSAPRGDGRCGQSCDAAAPGPGDWRGV